MSRKQQHASGRHAHGLDGSNGLHCATELTLMPLGRGRTLAQVRSSGTNVVLDAADVLMMTLMAAPAPIDVHVAQVAHALPMLKGRDVEDRVRKLQSSGCIVSASSLRTALRGRPADRATPGHLPRTCAVPTLGRPRELQRLLESLPRLGWEPEVSISGEWDSDAPEDVAAVLRGRKDVRVVTRGLRRERARALATRIGSDPRVLEWALCGSGGTCSVGANRNSLLLLAGPAGVLFLDDDTVVDARSSAAPPQQAVFSGSDPRETMFAPTADLAIGATQAVDGAPLRDHMMLVGRGVLPWAQDQLDEGSELPGLTPTIVRRLGEGSSRVVGVCPGIVGDLAIDSPVERLYMTGESRKAYVTDPRIYGLAKDSRWGVRMAPRIAVCPPTVCQTYALGLDTNETLPPFMPVGRGEDGVFGVVLQAIEPAALFTHVPVAVTHLPAEQRPSFGPRDWSEVGTIWMSTLLGCVVSSLAGDSRQRPVVRMEMLGRELEALGSLEPAAFWQEAERCVAASFAHQIQSLAQLLDVYAGEPEHWADDARRRMALLEACVTATPATLRLLDVDREGAQQYVRLYGSLLQMWPAVWAEAPHLDETVGLGAA